MPSPETEITTKGTTDTDKDFGDLNDSMDDQDNLNSKETLETEIPTKVTKIANVRVSGDSAIDHGQFRPGKSG